MGTLRRFRRDVRGLVVILLVAGAVAAGAPLWADEAKVTDRLADRGRGIPTSLFGTYIEKGQFLVYPFYEYTRTTAFEYKPSELGFVGEQDFLGKTTEHESLIFLAYGITDRLEVEFEAAAYAKISFDKASDDPSNVPSRIEESGLGDVDMHAQWRWTEETENRPEMYSFVEITPPFQKSRVLLGTQDWEANLGFGVIRGYRWGTITGRATLAYDGQDGSVEPGEYAFEYLKRVSSRWRFLAALEGESDELSLIGEAQWFFSPRAFLKLNCGLGLTQKAPDIAPEVGVLFHF
jgi:hypothetical protein